MSEALFLRLLPYEDKDDVLAETIAILREGRALNSVVHTVDVDSFEQVPGSPFAYWVSERIRQLFTELQPFETEGRRVKQGLATADDFRFVRTSWEVPPEKTVTGNLHTKREDFSRQTLNKKRWVPFAKGGAYSPYYADLHLVVNWEQNGKEIKTRINPETDRPYSNVWQLAGTERDYFFRPGLTYTVRTSSFSPRAIPSGAIFSHRANVLTSNKKWKPLEFLGILGSSVADFLIKTMLGRYGHPSFEIGIVAKVPVPEKEDELLERLGDLSLHCSYLKRELDTVDETSHVFYLSALLHSKGASLGKCADSWQQHIDETEQQLAAHQREIDDIAFRLYGIDGADREAIEATLVSSHSSADDEEVEADSADETEAEQPTADHRQLTADLLSYFVGCAFGRWDVRYATAERPAPELPDPFAPLPVCAPGALTGADGLPLRKSPPGYPLRVDWDGILVDDPDHDDDIIRRVRDVFELLWQKRAEEIEREACALLGVKELRDYFRKPAAGGFWTDHVKRYSKSRRKAPIYWLLQSSKKSYALWLYYHRLDNDILFKALLKYVEPKIRLEESALSQLRAGRADAGAAGKAAKQLEKQLERQESLLSELYDFRDKLKRAADLHLEPDLNDGVVLNIAPLWELAPWGEAKKYWEELLAGKYEWSSIGEQLKQKGLVKR